ncbi:hypothetical protein EVAR_86415_1 [Eumeta japonica]|uniref:Uncharacterized protein n=1 Tax=Eumeta variegata TaxID=151549 RepID=A0A4C1WBG4_EUMVA|nr:hypothetical protein EVAR_86415_1 [Eumeta japonica]
MRAITKKMVNAALGHSQLQRSHKCVAGVFGKNSMEEKARNLTRRTGPFLSHSQAYHNMGPPPYYADMLQWSLVISNPHWVGVKSLIRSSNPISHEKRYMKAYNSNLDNLFGIAHADAFDRIKIEEDKDFLRKQRETGRPGCLNGIDKKLAKKEERVRQRRLEEEERKNADEEQISNSKLSTQIPCPEKSSKRGMKSFITPKLVAALDRCQLNRTLDDFVTQRSKQFLSRLQIDDSFLREDVSSWGDNPSFLEARRRISRLKVVNDTAERALKLMQDFNGFITAEVEQKQFLLRCVQEHRNLYPDCKKTTLKRSYPN